MLPLVLIAILQIHSIGTEHVKIQPFNKDLKENIESGNNTKLKESPQYSNELVAYNQLLPYLYSKLPIPGSLINQLRKYNINKNMLNKIHSYNKLRRELHSKLIENEINGYKYNDILSKKLQTLFKSVNKEEKKNFLNLINYLKMFNFDNNKLYNTLNDGNDLLKLINNNKMKYLPLINSEKTLPDIFINNKVNKEIRRKLNQYKISSNDLYKKLINKINPAVLEELNKKSLVFDSKKPAQFKDVDPNNPSDLLKKRIDDLTSFNKKPQILPLNENLPKSYIGKNDDIQEIKNAQKKKIDGSLVKYIKELQLLNEIEKERDQLVNMKIEDLMNPKKNTDEQNKSALLKTNPSNALLALYLVLSIPGLLSALPNKSKKLPHIRNTKENILKNSHIEAGKLYNYLMNKNLKESINKIHDALKKEKHINKLGSLNINDLDGKKIASVNKKNIGTNKLMKLNYHPFGHQHSNELINDDNYYDAPVLPQYGMNPVHNQKTVKLNGHELYSALRSRNKLAPNEPTVINQNKDAEDKYVDYKVNGDQLFAYLKKTRSNHPKEKSSLEKFDSKIDGKMLFNQLGQSKLNKGGWKEDTIYSKRSDSPNNSFNNKININDPEINGEQVIDGSVLYNLLKDKQTDTKQEDQLTKNKINNNNTKNQIRGQDLFDLLDPSGQYMYTVSTGENKKKAKKLNMDKFYQKLYQEYMKDNKGVLKSMGTKTHQNKVVWNDQNVEIPNISALNMNDNTKQNIKAENEKNDQESNEALQR